PRAALKVVIAVDAAETLTSLRVTATDSAATSFNPSTDLAALATDATSGIAIYNDAGATAGSFDATDAVVTLSSASAFSSGSTTLTLASAGAAGTYYIVFRTASATVNGHSFVITMPTNGIDMNANDPTLGVAVVTSAIAVDTVAPTVDINMTGPQNNSTNVPVSMFIHVGLSENLDQSTLTYGPSGNVNLTQNSNNVAASIRPFPNGFDVITSLPPTYTASSSFAKAASTSSAFYFMQGSNPIVPQGSYTTPVTGDVVFFQNQSFPPEVGVVTNATLTSGTFAVNDFNLFGGQQLIKFGTVAATGLQGASTALVVGDIVVANVSANPTGVKYNWHLVTAGNNVNDANLRLDGAAAAPTFVTSPSSRVSRITPTDTSAVNSSSQVVGTGGSGINLAVGDLLFANITANADNLNSYAWHLVTAAQNFTTDTAATTLRLDSNATAPTFAVSSQISQLATAATGAVTESATVFSAGNIAFAKTTANASSNGVYNFHLVSSGATGANSTSLRFDNSSADLLPSTTYILTTGTGVKDSAGNPLASASTLTFTTGGNSGTNNTPPSVQTTTPQPGSQTFPIGANISLQFSVAMSESGAGSVTSATNVGLFLNTNGNPSGSAIGSALSYASATNTLTINPTADLTASTDYVVTVASTTTSSTGAAVMGFRLYFRTASGAADTIKPTITGVFPGVNASSVALPVSDISIGFSEDIDGSTFTATNVVLRNVTDSTDVAGNITYNPQQRAAHFSPTAALIASKTYRVTIGTGSIGTTVKDISGNGLRGNGGVDNAVTAADALSSYAYTFGTSATADTVDPTVQFANADNFNVAITFSEGMKSGGGPSAADNITNYTLESPVGTTISLGGKAVTYDGPTMTAKISGLSLQNGVTFKLTASNVLQDLSGRSMSASANNTTQGTVANSSQTGGQLGPGSGQQQTGGQMGMTPIRVSPMTRAAGATSNYMVEMPVTTTIPVDGSIVLTFPTGFDVTSANKMTAGTESPSNGDINGPGAGAVTIGTVAVNVSARTVTVPIAGAATGANTFLRFDLKGIKNSTVPNSSGYTVDIKTKNDTGTILETLTSGDFFLGQAGTRTVTVTVFNDNGANPGGGGVANDNIKNGSEADVDNVTVFLFSPASGGQNGVTSSGQVQFTSIADGDYQLGLDPGSVAAAGNFIFNSMPQPVNVAGNVSKPYGLTAAPRLISGTITVLLLPKWMSSLQVRMDL
ncbi:MAG: hypothetical protein A2846_03885, partial [Candidatus Doudnabacteria bacterium RIFCSPHIGHO2_01_FULL_49_9]